MTASGLSCATAVTAVALALTVAYLVAHALLRARAGVSGYHSVLWWALSALPIAAAGLTYRRHIPVGSVYWWAAFAATTAVAIAWVLYGVLRAIPLLRHEGEDR